MIQFENNNFTFICSPSLGILDNWLPVIWNLKSRNPKSKFTIVFPKLRTLLEINQQSVLTKIALNCFDEVLFKKRIGWSRADSLFDAMNLASTLEKHISSRVYNRINSRYRFLLKSWHLMDECVSANNLKKWVLSKNRDSEKIILLCDIYEESKSYNQLFLQEIGDTPRFSIHHGVDVSNGGVFSKDLQQYNVPDVEQRKVVIFSELDRKIWQHQYELNEEQVISSAIPKHDKKWIKRIQNMSKDKLASIPDRFIGVIGRPCTSTYLPRDRKISVLRDILQAAEKHKLPIVVKRHPKEIFDGTYEEVFGESTLGSKWFLTDAHWFGLAENCVFAVCFYSSVPVDLIKLGIPVIEYLNLKGLPEHDNERALRDGDGNPVLSYRYLGLVFGVDDTHGFENKVNEITLDRNKLAEKLYTEYENVFINSKDPVKKIINSIEEIIII